VWIGRILAKTGEIGRKKKNKKKRKNYYLNSKTENYGNEKKKLERGNKSKMGHRPRGTMTPAERNKNEG